jgi:mediator of RNA polymerase II transcription subunit 7
MADAQQQPNEDDADLLIAPLPPPPPFFQHFTTGNLEKLSAIQTENQLDTLTDDGAPAQLSAEQILALPIELRYLIPPEPPADSDEFKVFGAVTSVKGTDSFAKAMEFISRSLGGDYTLTDWTYEKLYASTDASSSAAATTSRQKDLFGFNRSLTVAYLELLGILSVNPTSEQKDQKLRDILTLVTNMHALINEYRPHQARETLILEMERQVERKKREIEGVRKMRERVREVLEGFGREVPGERVESGEEEVKSEEVRRGEAQRCMWMAMDEILG